MNQYAILRRNGWRSAGDLEEAAERSTKVGNEDMPDDIRWIRSYVLDEGDGAVGTVCIYEASSPEAIREHASCADLPVDEIIPIADTVIVRPDPQAAASIGPVVQNGGIDGGSSRWWAIHLPSPNRGAAGGWLGISVTGCGSVRAG